MTNAASSRQIRVTTCFSRKVDKKLPVFHRDDLAWLVAETLTNVHAGELSQEDALPIGVSVSIASESAEPDVLCLAHGTRIVLVQLLMYAFEEPPIRFSDPEQHPGFVLLIELLLCSSANSLQPMRQASSANVALVIASLTASEMVYLFYKWFNVHSSMLDLELLAGAMGLGAKIHPFDAWSVCMNVLGKDAHNHLKMLDESWCTVFRSGVQLDNLFLNEIMESIRLAVASFKSAEFLLRECRQGKEAPRREIDSCTVDTRNVPVRLLDSMALFTHVETALYVSKPKESQTYLRNFDGAATAAAAGNVMTRAVEEDGLMRFEVLNEQYKTRIMRSSRQQHDVTFDVDGVEKTFRARAIDSVGKSSTLEFCGREAGEAMRLIRLNDAAVDDGEDVGPRPKAMLRRIFVKGREGHTRADIMGMTWRRTLLLEGAKVKHIDFILYLLYGEPLDAPKFKNRDCLDTASLELMEKPWLDGFSIIKEKESASKLNASQAKAARAILSPLTKEPFANEANDNDEPRCPADRLILVHGPPGTGKTSLITACCLQFAHASKIQVSMSILSPETAKKMHFTVLDTIYACCQSNVAVKNIGESLSRNGVDFRIVVSPNFYVEWHEDLYDDIKGRLITSDKLPTSKEVLSEQFDGCHVILSTLAFLSSARFSATDSALRQLRPIRLLMVDEASQIHVRQYPHLIHSFAHQTARIVFFGDDHQLAPFNSESSNDLGISVFELDHLRPKAFLLDTCYRLPKPMVEFISANVYDGKVRVGHSNLDPAGGLLDCVAFVDVSNGRESREGKSRKNDGEVGVVLALIQSFKDRGGDMKEIRVLTTYDAQREALQKALKQAGLSGDADLVFSVDAFQGHECQHVILSLVRDGRPTVHNFKRSAPMIAKPNLGFLRNERRTNVALTRAKRSLTIVSNRTFIEDVGCDTLAGKLQVAVQFAQPNTDVEYWLKEEDVLNGTIPERLFELE